MTDLSHAPIARIMFTQPQRMGDNTSQFATSSKVRIEPLPCGGVLLRPLKGNAWYELADIEPGGSEKRKLWYVVKVEREGIASRSYEVGEDGEAMELPGGTLDVNAGSGAPPPVCAGPFVAARDCPEHASDVTASAPYTPVVGVVKQRKRGEKP